MNTNTKVLSLAALSCLGGLASTPVWAGSLVTDAPDSCTAINCGSQSIIGTYIQTQFSEAIPFTTQVFVPPIGCVRLDVVSQVRDFEMVLIAPDGTIRRNDDRNGLSDRRPLIKANASSAHGWYTVQVSSHDGNEDPGTFVLRYGLYTSTANPNCLGLTPPS